MLREDLRRLSRLYHEIVTACIISFFKCPKSICFHTFSQTRLLLCEQQQHMFFGRNRKQVLFRTYASSSAI